MHPIAAAIAYLPDIILGEELGDACSRDQLKVLSDAHSRDKVGILTDNDVLIFKGALDLSQKTVAETMTEVHDAFRLDIDAVLDRSALKWIMKVGH